jgi:hypothetical protein
VSVNRIVTVTGPPPLAAMAKRYDPFVEIGPKRPWQVRLQHCLAYAAHATGAGAGSESWSWPGLAT